MIRLLVEVLATVLVQSLTMLGLLLSWLPQIVRAALGVLRLFLVLSCALYRGVAQWLSQFTQFIGLDLNRQPWRALFSALMSIGIGALICTAMGWGISPRILVGSGIHGLIVAFVWDQMRPPDGQSLGR